MATALPKRTPSANISRIITAAVINQSFRQLLLSNPEKAISTGFNGESFRLERDEQELILSIKATTLADFATKVTSLPKMGETKTKKLYRAYLRL